MLKTLRIENGQSNLPVADVHIVKDDDGNKTRNRLVTFNNGRLRWLLLYNDHYKENIAMEFPNEHYNSSGQVPVYKIHEDKRKVGWVFPRAKNGKKYLYFHRQPTRRLQYPQKYYVFGKSIGDDFEIEKRTYLIRLL